MNAAEKVDEWVKLTEGRPLFVVQRWQVQHWPSPNISVAWDWWPADRERPQRLGAALFGYICSRSAFTLARVQKELTDEQFRIHLLALCCHLLQRSHDFRGQDFRDQNALYGEAIKRSCRPWWTYNQINIIPNLDYYLKGTALSTMLVGLEQALKEAIPVCFTPKTGAER